MSALWKKTKDMRLFASLKMICAAALLTASFCSCSSTGTHAISPASDAAYREYLNKARTQNGLNL
jgi:hypothetical protein